MFKQAPGPVLMRWIGRHTDGKVFAARAFWVHSANLHLERSARPVPYQHPYGAVIWVTFADEVSRSLTRRLRATHLTGADLMAAPDQAAPQEADRGLDPAGGDQQGECAGESRSDMGIRPRSHLWWARRPLAACRAVLFAQLVDDPSSCPEEFPTKRAQDAERDRLHKLIERLVPWEASNNELILNEARYEIARSVARGRGDKLPPIGQMKPQRDHRLSAKERAAGLRPILGRRLDPAGGAAARA